MTSLFIQLGKFINIISVKLLLLLYVHVNGLETGQIRLNRKNCNEFRKHWTFYETA